MNICNVILIRISIFHHEFYGLVSNLERFGVTYVMCGARGYFHSGAHVFPHHAHAHPQHLAVTIIAHSSPLNATEPTLDVPSLLESIKPISRLCFIPEFIANKFRALAFGI